MQLKDTEISKEAAGKKAADFILPGMTVGLGTGSTSAHFIKALGKRVQNGLTITAVATSKQSFDLGKEVGIVMKDIDSVEKLDITVDGADEIDHKKEMIKGGGGALLREKIVAHMSLEMIVIVDESKYVEHLGKFPLPVEISPFGFKVTLKELEKLGSTATLRKNKDGSFYITENGNYIADLKFKHFISNPKNENLKLKMIPGVLETGLFIGMAGRVIIGYPNKEVKII